MLFISMTLFQELKSQFFHNSYFNVTVVDSDYINTGKCININEEI